MKLLITGGAGFIGSNFLDYMLKKYPNYSFVCLDKLTIKNNINNIENAMKFENFKFIKGDITNKNFIDKVFKEENFDLVVNFAAEISVDYSITNPDIFINTNIIGTAILMNACLKYKVKRFHQISTDEVYGDLPLNSKKKFSEKSILKPSSPYSSSKAAADLLILSYHRTYGLNATISRCTNNYGPRQSYQALIPIVIKKAINKEKIPVFGNGKNIRNWLYVYDHVTAIDLIIHKGIPGKIYNVSSKDSKNNINVIKNILKILKINDNIITFVKDRPGHDLKYALNSNKIKRCLGWKEKYNFEKGIKETIDWYKQKIT